MAQKNKRSRSTALEHHPTLEHERQERKQRVLTKGTPSVTRSIADAVVIKSGNPYFLAEPSGDVTLGGRHGFGLYYRDCRYLNGYELRFGGASPVTLVASAERGFSAVFQITNPDLRLENGRLIPKETISGRWLRVIDGERLALDDLITIENLGLESVELPLELTFSAAFEDVFSVRGLLEEHRGKLHEPRWEDGVLSFVYDGADGIQRRLDIFFDPAPGVFDGTTARFILALGPRGQRELQVTLQLHEASERRASGGPSRRPDPKRVQELLHQETESWVANHTQVTTNSLLLNRVMQRSLRDLAMLRSVLGDDHFFAAGLPWFGTLFGRDSLITALQTLAFDPAIAAQTLRVLARHQGKRVDDWRDEQPGKILHELRVGELARLGEVPHSPYYGTVDATLLFLILLREHAAWTGSLDLFQALRENVDRALEWLERYADIEGSGYVQYASSSEKGLVNQGWKDSGDAIVNADGSLAEPPIALVEVQGYAYQARLAMAELFERAGEGERAAELRRQAEALRQRFNRDFWIEDLGCLALALQRGGRPCAVVSSNPGQALWSGIVDQERAARTVQRLMAPDMYNGWGIRTLSAHERRYNPIGYHLGTVWPHDNALIAAGFRRYGFDQEALRVFDGIVSAATHFEHERLPELFAGFERDAYGVPVRYPVADHPQAWASGTIPYLMTTLLGLAPEAFDRRLRIVRPLLPDFVSYCELHGLRVGQARADLSFERTERGTIAVTVSRVEGDLDIVIQPTRSSAEVS